MNLTRKTKIIVVIISLTGAFAAGRWSTPVKIKTETKIVIVEKKTDDATTAEKKDDHKKVVTVEKDLPTGEKDITTTVTDDTQTKVDKTDKSTDNTNTKSDTTKEVTKGSSPVTIAALAGVNPLNPSSGMIYGANVYKPILGPLGIGVWVLSNSTCGLSVGLSF